MWRTGILRKRITADKKDMEKVINILMSIGYTHCSIHDSKDYYGLSASILEDDDESNIKKKSLQHVFKYVTGGDRYRREV